jgi:hypothetical protein
MKKWILSIVLLISLVTSSQANALKIAGAIMQLLGLDVPIVDYALKGLEKKYGDKEKKNWKLWQGLYDDFIDVFKGRTRQVIERNLGFSLSSTQDFESLINNAHRFLDNLETNPYYSHYLDTSRLGKMRKLDEKNKEPDPEDPNPEGQEEKTVEFRAMLLQPEAEKILEKNYFTGNEDIKAQIDETIKKRQEELKLTEGLLDLLTQVKRDEEERIVAMVKKLDEVMKNSQGQKIKNKDAEKEDQVADTSAALGTLISVAHDLAMVNESVHKMVKVNREKNVFQFINQRKVVDLENVKDGDAGGGTK